MSQMPRETAVAFFAKLFHGEHHLPAEVKPWGRGWIISAHPSRFATFDFNDLTRLVLLAHDRCIRVEINSGGPGRIRIAVHQRDTREGSMMERHPTIEEALAYWRKNESPASAQGESGEQQ